MGLVTPERNSQEKERFKTNLCRCIIIYVHHCRRTWLARKRVWQHVLVFCFFFFSKLSSHLRPCILLLARAMNSFTLPMSLLLLLLRSSIRCSQELEPRSGTFSVPPTQDPGSKFSHVAVYHSSSPANPHSNESFEFKTDMALLAPPAAGRHRAANRAGTLRLEHLCSISKQSPLHQQTACPVQSPFWIFEGERKKNIDE